MTEYPVDFPLENIRDIVNIVRSGDIKSQASTLAFNIWVVQGYGQKTFIGAPDNPVSLLRVQKAESADGLCVLEQMLSDEPMPQASIPWDFVLDYLFDLLRDLLNNLEDA